VLLAFSRVGGERVPHEAIIGVIYVVAAAMNQAIGHEEDADLEAPISEHEH
jgi:hypothetical protein